MNDNQSLTAVCYGEVLWDVFPDHKTIGGAPLNVALRLKSLGIDTAVITRIGTDSNGKALTDYLSANGLDLFNVQIDNEHKTGIVNVALNNSGSASYEIEYPVAWDKIQLTERAVELVKTSDTFVFGSLACRDKISKNTLLELLEFAKFKVFDVNLRPPHYSYELLLELMHKADFIKLNDEELLEICNHMGISASNLKNRMQLLSKRTNSRIICLTKGKNGAALLVDGSYYENQGYKVTVEDTVGAGDSFLATLIAKLLQKSTPEIALNHACVVGALVASKKGANPKISLTDIERAMSKQ
ncbi:MAG: carbohydrate kinase [Flavobacteriaceae bacterium]|nr:carbohydrate kinase [Flavobacteriaceae bacterium]